MTTRSNSYKKKTSTTVAFKRLGKGRWWLLVLLVLAAGTGSLWWHWETRRSAGQAYTARADALRAKGQLAEATQYYMQAAAANPTLAQVWEDLGSALVAQHRFAEALGPLERAVELQPDLFDAQGSLAITHAMLGHFLPAEAHYQQAIRLQPDRGAVYYNLGSLYKQQGPPPGSLGAVQKSRGVAARSPPSLG